MHKIFCGGVFCFDYREKEYNVKVPVLGRHFVYNSLCAIAVARTLNIEPEQALEGISKFKLTE